MYTLKSKDPHINALLELLEDVLNQNVLLEKEIETEKLKNQEYASIITSIRTPLTVIRTSANIVNHYYQQLSSEKRNIHLDNIDSQVEYIIQLLQELSIISSNNLHANPA